MRYNQGIFHPKHPEKYVGDLDKIFYRSGWEKKLMLWCDNNPSILKWGSEEIVIHYFDPIKNKPRRYFPDFVILYKHRDGTEQRVVVEVKPDKQTRMPAKPQRQTRRYLTEMTTYVTNEAKWKAAIKWCDEKGFKFMIITEKHLHV